MAVGQWDDWYEGITEPTPFGGTLTYELGAAFLADCEVEDWGCGLGWMRRFVTSPYRGIDGSHSPFVDEIVDLETYRSKAEGIFMRHVLEHNYGWKHILTNALVSFQKRFVLVIFTPFGRKTQVIAQHGGIPDISFATRAITSRLRGLTWLQEKHSTDTIYGTETIFYVQR